MQSIQRKLLLVTLFVSLPVFLTACTQRNQNNTTAEKPQTENSPQITIKDGNWNKYTNNEFKYSLDIPNQYYINQGSCMWDAAAKSFIYKPAPSPAQIIEKGDSTYIFPAITYSLDESGDCNKVESDTENVDENTPNSWRIHAFKAELSAEINDVIKTEYGEGCLLEVLRPTVNQDEYDVIISKSPECSVDYAYFIKYNNKTKTGISIKLGKSFTFLSDANAGNNAYDETILKSLVFFE